MKNEFIETANVRKFNTICMELESPASLIGHSMAAVTGKAGHGKSEAAKQYAVNSTAIYVPPMVGRSKASVFREIAFELAKVRPTKCDASEFIIQEEMRRDRRLIIIDEADLLENKVLDALRNINERYACPIMLIGEEELKGRIGSRGRLQDRIRLNMEFGPVLQQDVAFYFKRNFSLTVDKEVSAAILRYGKGTWRRVLKFAVTVERAMIASGVSEISLELATMTIADLVKDEYGRKNS